MSPSLAAQPWIAWPSTTAVFDALEALGGAESARFVGGCVRNAVLDRPVDDIDIATPLTPDLVIRAVEAAGLRAVPTGVDHGTVTAIVKGRPFEITTLRRDVETDGRRAVVAFTTDWAEDAARRDFTLNALYADRQGEIFDPTGEGLADARAGRIRFVGEAGQRIREDYLRILRFFRFLAWYGRGEPDRAALEACAALKDGVSTLAAERISKELLKLLAADDPRTAMELMDKAGVLRLILPETVRLARFDRLAAIESEQLFVVDGALRLAALAPDEAGAAARIAARLRLSNALRDRLVAALGPGPQLASGMSPRALRRAVYQLGPAVFTDRLKLAWAGAERAGETARWRSLLAMAEAWTPPVFPLNGEDAMAAGAPKGPKVGEVLRAVEAWWIEQDFPDDKPAMAERLKAAAKELGA
jgi:poly(A) polymerase